MFVLIVLFSPQFFLFSSYRR